MYNKALKLLFHEENYYFTKKITNLRRKSRVKVQKSGLKSKKVGSKSTLLILEENYYFAKKTNILRVICEENYYFAKKSEVYF